MMTLDEAVKTWNAMKSKTDYQALSNEATHALFHEVVSVIRPAIQAGLISAEVL